MAERDVARRRSRPARSRRRSCAARRAPPACAPGRPSRRPRRPPAAGRTAGKPRRSSTRSTSDGSPRSSRSAGPRLTATRGRTRRRRRSPISSSARSSTNAVSERPSPRVVGERQEVGRHQQPAARVRPAHERLDAAHLAGRDLRLRLVVQDELAARRARRAARRAARAGGGCGGRARAGRPRGRCACAWPRTSRRRRAAAARARRRACSGKSAMPMLASMCTRIPPTRERALQRRAQPQAGGAAPTPRRPGRARPRTRRRRAATSVSPSRSASCSRGPIWRSTSSPACVAERVVELLEAVEVDQQQRDLARPASSIASLEPREQVAAVAEPGQVVGDRVRAALARRRSTIVSPARAMPVSTVTVASVAATGGRLTNCPTTSSVSAVAA